VHCPSVASRFVFVCTVWPSLSDQCDQARSIVAAMLELMETMDHLTYESLVITVSAADFMVPDPRQIPAVRGCESQFSEREP
jgi:hypothetical protein